MKPKIKSLVARFADLLLWPFALISGALLVQIRSSGIQNFPRIRRMLTRVGVFPIRRHYYEPLFHPDDLRHSLSAERELPGFDLNISGQLTLLGQLRFGGELADLDDRPKPAPSFHFGNGAFESGDAEFWYSMIRLVKPKRIIEIGSGYSTLLAQRAIKRNTKEDRKYVCHHLCVEPYAMPWLAGLDAEIRQQAVETLDLAFFDALSCGDILFIDSSHVLRPQGDVVFEYLQILPRLRPGVWVHVHDIFTPRDYPAKWVLDEVRFWTEQYILEAFLTGNRDWEVAAALNLLHHRHFDDLKLVCPHLTADREPGSFYLRRKHAA